MDNITKMFNIKPFVPITKTSLSLSDDSHHVPVLGQDNERTIPSYVRLNSTGEVEEEQDLFRNSKNLYTTHFGHQNTEMSQNQQSLLGIPDPATFRGGSGSPSKNFLMNGIQQGYKVFNPYGKKWHDHNMAGNVLRYPTHSFQFQPRFDGNQNYQFGCNKLNHVPYQCYQHPRSHTPRMSSNFFQTPNGQTEPHLQIFTNFHCGTPGAAMKGKPPCVHREGSPRRWNRGKRNQKHPTNRTELNKSAHNNSQSSPKTMTPRCTKNGKVTQCQSQGQSKCDSEKTAFQEANDIQTIHQAKSLKVCDSAVEKVQEKMTDLSIEPSDSKVCVLNGDSASIEVLETTTVSKTNNPTVCEGNEHQEEIDSKLHNPSTLLPKDSSSSKLSNTDEHPQQDDLSHQVPKMSPLVRCKNIAVTVKEINTHSDAININGKTCDRNDKAAKDSDNVCDLLCEKNQSLGECFSEAKKEQICHKPADRDIPDMEIEFKDTVETQREDNVFLNGLITPGKKGKKGRPSSKKRRRMKLQRDPDNICSLATITASTKKLKTCHGKDKIGASSSGIRVQIKCNDISMEKDEDDHDKDMQHGPKLKTPPKTCRGVAFILGLEDSDDEETIDPINGKTQRNSEPSPVFRKFSFLISLSDSDDSSDADSEPENEDKDQVDSSFNVELWNSFADFDDPDNPMKAPISCSLTPSVDTLPKSASDSDLACSSQLAKVNNKWNIRYSVQLESEPLKVKPKDDTTPKSKSEKKKVHFPENDLEELVSLPAWDITQGWEDRRGIWEQVALDRFRFAKIIKEVGDNISHVFEPELRQRIYNSRFNED